MGPILRHVALVASSVLAATSVLAQPVPPAAKADDITVTADKAAESSSIDRKSYAIDRDLQSVTGTAADVLGKLPSVDVDASGAVSIRGSTSIQVLIDGKPSTAASSSNRGEYLQTIPASSIERIEVITNPSARFKPDGTAGLINIILKKNRKPGYSATVTANAGSDGRYNLGIAPSWRQGPLNVTGSATLKRDRPYRPFGTRRTQTDAAGQVTDSRQDGLVRSRRLSRIAALNADYDVTEADRLSAGYSWNRRTGTIRFAESNRAAVRDGPVLSDFDRTATGTERRLDHEATARYRHAFAGKGHELTIDLRQGATVQRQSRTFADSYRVPAGLVAGDRQQPSSDERQREATVEYARPLAKGAKLLLGYDIQRDEDAYDNRGDTIDASGRFVPNPALTSRFDFAQTVHAAYATYERPIGKLTALLGLRGEVTRTNSRPGAAAADRREYSRVYPTLHLDYTLSDAKTLRFSYSHRIVRPEPEDLNPYPLFQNPLNLRAGNPALRPQETDSVEASYEYGVGRKSFSLTPYVRVSTNVFSDFSRFVAPDVLLTTQANIGNSLAAGSEAALGGPLGRTLTYSVSGNLAWSRINAGNLAQPVRSGVVASAKASLDWKASARDLVQVSVTWAGRRLVPQGERRSAPSLNLGIRHQLKPDLAAVLTVTDVFDSARDRLVIAESNFRDASTYRRARRAATLALSWSFGAEKKASPKFDYSN